ncbi:MAG: CPBP family intramembrane glutamic endopeptidase [Bryobacteraceae bacterium]|jgi:membrane protease YdiL (CAAX protease family)
MIAPRAVFMGPNGLRAGWRLLIFFAILIPMGYGASWVIDPAMRKLHAELNTPMGILVYMAVLVAVLLSASGIMARIEGRGFADYGLPWRRALCRQFWQGAAISFASLTALLFALRLAGALSFGSPALHGADIWKFGILWTLPVFLAALLEDFFYRGYLLFTLTSGIGFWPAALATSLLMAGAHYFNPGGHGPGPFAVLLYCLVTCLVLRRTGDLWMPLGLHAAWSWGEVFFYGVPASGQVSQGHLFNASLHGPAWLTGGVFGPEAGWPNIALLAIWWILFSTWLREVKYPKQTR